VREELGNAQGKLMTADLNFSCLRKMWSKNVNSMFSLAKDKHRKKQQLSLIGLSIYIFFYIFIMKAMIN
jgi:hypothetical protein